MFRPRFAFVLQMFVCVPNGGSLVVPRGWPLLPRGWRRAPGSSGKSETTDQTRLHANKLPQGASGRQRRESESSPVRKDVTALLPPSFHLPPSCIIRSFLPFSFFLPSSFLLLSFFLPLSFLPPVSFLQQFTNLSSESRIGLQRPPVAGFHN